ncbi:MAG: hypothetical protein AAF467_12435 [Actinomycetota bacterium]
MPVRSRLGVAVVATTRTTARELNLAIEAALHAAGHSHLVVSAPQPLVQQVGRSTGQYPIEVSDGTWADGVRRCVLAAPTDVLLLAPAAAVTIREALLSMPALHRRAAWTRSRHADRCGMLFESANLAPDPVSNGPGLPGPGSVIRVAAFRPVFDANPEVSVAAAAADLLSDGWRCGPPTATALLTQGDRAATLDLADAVEWRAERLRTGLNPRAWGWSPGARASRQLLRGAWGDLSGTVAAATLSLLVLCLASGLIAPGSTTTAPAGVAVGLAAMAAISARAATAGRPGRRPGRWVQGLFDDIDLSLRAVAAAIGLPARSEPRFAQPVASILAAAIELMLLVVAWRTYRADTLVIWSAAVIVVGVLVTLAPLLVSLRVISRRPKRRTSARLPIARSGTLAGRPCQLVDVSVFGVSVTVPIEATLESDADGLVPMTVNNHTVRLRVARQHARDAETFVGLHVADGDADAAVFLQRLWLTALSLELRALATRSAADERADTRIVIGGSPALRVLSVLTVAAIVGSMSPPYPTAFAATGPTGAGGDPTGFDADADWWVETVGGTISAEANDGSEATDVGFEWPRAAVHDDAGNLYVADSPRSVVYRIDTDGITHTYAGTGHRGYAGDDGPAVDADLAYPVGLAWHDDTLYIADYGNHTVRAVGPDATISTVMGDGSCRARPRANVIATSSTACRALDVDVDDEGRVLVAVYAHHQVMAVETDGTTSVVAGTGLSGNSGDGGQAARAAVGHPYSVVKATDGTVYIGTTGNHHGVRRIDPNGRISTIAGEGRAGHSGDGGPAIEARIRTPLVSLDGDGQLLISDLSSHRIRTIDADGIISTIAGTGNGRVREGRLATATGIPYPGAVSIGPDGSWVVPDRRRLRRIDTDGIVTTIAGTGYAGSVREVNPAATDQALGTLVSVAAAADGSYYLASRYDHRVRRVAPDGTTSVIAGTGERGFSGDGGPATAARLNQPWGLELAADGTLYVADHANHRIRAITPGGTITTVAGTGAATTNGDGGPAIDAALRSPTNVVAGSDGSLYVSSHHRIRRVAPDGEMSTLAGTGAYGFSGDGGLAAEATFRAPRDLAIGPDGSLYVADVNNRRIRRITPNGMIETVVGRGSNSRVGSLGGPASDATIRSAHGLAVDRDGQLWIAAERHVLRVAPDGVIHRVAGHYKETTTGVAPATKAEIHPVDVDLGPDGRPVWVTSKGLLQTVTPAPPAPSHVAVDEITDSSARVSWAPVDSGDIALAGYEITIGRDVWTTQETSHTIRGLADDETHTVSVSALVGRGRTATVSAQFTTQRDEDATPYSSPFTLGGGGLPPQEDTGPALQMWLGNPERLTEDDAGNVYVSTTQHQIWRIGADGQATVIAGNGLPGHGRRGFAGDGGPSRQARLHNPQALAWRDGVLYVADRSNHRVRAIAADGTITTVAGGRGGGLTTSGSPATATPVQGPRALAFDPDGRLVIGGAYQVVRLEADGTLTVLMGDGRLATTGDGGPATAATVNRVIDVAVGDDGRVFVLDETSARVRAIGTDGIVTTVAGTAPGPATGDGGAAVEAVLDTPTGIDVGADGTLVIVGGARLRVVGPDGIISTMVGSGQATAALPGPVDGSRPLAAVDAVLRDDGSVLATETGQGRVVSIDTARHLSILGGSTQRVTEVTAGRANQAYLGALASLDVTAEGAVLTTSTNTGRVWSITPQGQAAIMVGGGTEPVANGVAARDLDLARGPQAIAASGDGQMYLLAEHRLLRIDETGGVVVVAGSGESPRELGPDGQPALEAALGTSQALAIGPDGAVYIADDSKPSIRRLDPDGTLTTVVGTGQAGDNGAGRAGTETLVASVRDLTFDSQDRLLYTDYDNNVVRRVETDGTVTTVAGTGAAASGPDGGQATATAIHNPTGVAVVGDSIYVSEFRGRIRQIRPDGTVATLFQNGRQRITDLMVFSSGSIIWGATDGRVRTMVVTPPTPEGLTVVRARDRGAVLRVDAPLSQGEWLEVDVAPDAPASVRGNRIVLADLDPQVTYQLTVSKADRFGSSGLISTSFRTTWRPEARVPRTAQVSARTVTITAEIESNGEAVTSIVAVATADGAASGTAATGGAAATTGVLVSTAEPAVVEAGAAKTVTATFSGLEPGRTYQFHFEATNELGTTSTEPISATTEAIEAEPLPRAPIDRLALPESGAESPQAGSEPTIDDDIPEPPPDDEGAPVVELTTLDEPVDGDQAQGQSYWGIEPDTEPGAAEPDTSSATTATAPTETEAAPDTGTDVDDSEAATGPTSDDVNPDVGSLMPSDTRGPIGLIGALSVIAIVGALVAVGLRRRLGGTA